MGQFESFIGVDFWTALFVLLGTGAALAVLLAFSSLVLAVLCAAAAAVTFFLFRRAIPLLRGAPGKDFDEE